MNQLQGVGEALQAVGGGWQAVAVVAICAVAYAIAKGAPAFFDYMKYDRDSQRRHEREVQKAKNAQRQRTLQKQERQQQIKNRQKRVKDQ